MVDYREILRLSSEGNSQRQIAASVGSSHHTVSEVLTTAKLKGIEWSNDDSITNEMLQSILFPDKYAAISAYLEPDYGHDRNKRQSAKYIDNFLPFGIKLVITEIPA